MPDNETRKPTVILVAQDVEAWIQLQPNYRTPAMNNRHILEMVARHIVDYRPQGLKRNQDWAEYLNACNLNMLANYFNGKLNFAFVQDEKEWLESGFYKPQSYGIFISLRTLT